MRLHLTLISLVSCVVAQDLGVPLSWRKFNNSRPLSERITIAQNAINQMTPQLNSATGEFNGIGYWQSGNVWSVLANQDHLAGTTTNKALVVNNLNLVFSRWAHYDQFQFNDDAMWWAQAALYGYRAYGDTNLLAHAVDVWTHVTGYVITAAQASARKNPNKSFALESTCNGVTMAGGVFWRPTTDDQSVNSVTTGHVLYITLSAFLAEYTKNATYTNAAILSANWIKSHNINANNLVLDTVNAFDCSTSPATWLFTYNSGKYIEGLSVLAAVTGDASWNTLMINILNAAVKTTAWEGSDGIITEGVSTTSNNDGVGFKAIFIRGIHEAWTRNPNNSALRILIHSYGDVQILTCDSTTLFSTLLRMAARIPSNWHGPPQAFTSWGQLAALDVLTSNIDTN
ncbi:Glycoside hydrolase family 76 protein [Mycena venus]|uniref:Glycoside hydrolase family 76 protein n=1 Tax=Mycena venus TaxID=2733690 RepID=A0A8H7CPL4_9AGAR|nr:Glycoside hydrolase family 76 protein [Mycena venus]